MKNISNKKLAYFLSVAETGNITKAAELNRVAQPTMTEYINRLEESLGIRLFERRSVPIRLTEAGKYYLEYAEAQIELDRELKARLESMNTDVTGEINIGVPAQFESLPQFVHIARFMEQYPKITVNLKHNTSGVLERAVRRMSLDFAFIHIADPISDRLQCLKLASHKILFVMSPDLPLVKDLDPEKRHTCRLPLAKMADIPFFLLDKGFIFRAVPESFFEKHGFIPLDIMSMNNINAMLKMALSGRGISLLPEYALSDIPYADQLVYAEAEEGSMSLDLVMVFSPSQESNPAGKIFLDYFRNQKP